MYSCLKEKICQTNLSSHFFKMPDFLDRGSPADLIYLGPNKDFDAAPQRKCRGKTEVRTKIAM